jgi:hypothetical protein
MRRRSILTTVLAGVMSIALTASGARAQAEIPKEIVEKPVHSAEDQAAVKKFLDERFPLFDGKDPGAMKRGRDELLSAFKNPRVSVAFRQSYNDAAMRELRKLAEDKNDMIVVTGLRIAGELATSDSTTILEAKLADPRVAVRFAAVNGLERTMAALAARNPAIPRERAEALVDKLGQVISDPKNNDYEVMDAAERALISAMNVTIGNVRPKAFQNLSASVAKLAQRFADQKTPPQIHIILVRAGETSRNALGAIQNPLAGDNVKDAASLSGHLLGWTMCQLKGGHLAEEEARDAAAKVAGVAENNIIIASQKAGVTAPSPQKLGDELAKGNNEGDNLFTRKIPEVLAPLAGGFKLTDNFLKCKAGG